EKHRAYRDAVSYPVMVLEDNPPRVELTTPGKDESLPADALLALEGRAEDDVGVKELTLRMKVNGTAIESRPYRSDKEIRLADGGYPHVLDYKDSVDLATVKDAKG